MPSRLLGRPACLRAVVVVFALVCSLFAVSPAHAAGTTISGKVTKPSGNGLADSVVDLYREYSDGYFFEKSVKTRSDGTYSFSSLPKDRYVVGFAAESKVYAAEFWNDVKEFEDAQVISLGSSAVSGKNAKLAVGATVRGRVLSEGPDAHGVADAEVAAYRLDGNGWTFDKSVQTVGDGTFQIGGLTDGRFTLEFNPPTDGPDADLALEYWPNQRTFTLNNFYLKLGETVDGFDAALSPGGRISGRVTGPDGEPIAGAPVFSYPSDEGADVGNVAITEDDGTYVMRGLSAGPHRLEFYGPYAFDEGYISEWWDDRSSFEDAETITVTAGETEAGKDAQLAAEGTNIVNTTRPTLSGTAKAGQIITADPGTWSVDNVAFRYQWMANGSPIEEVARATYRVRPQDVGKSISVRVTASRLDHTSGTATSTSTAPAVEGTVTLTKPPTLKNAERVGDRVQVVPGSWSMGPTWAGFLDYTPNRNYQAIVDGVDVPGATAQTLDITPDMIGKRISYREEVSLPGWIPDSATTEQSAPILPGRLCHGPPSIVGDVIAGEPVRASTGFGCHEVGKEPPPITFAYRWFVNGTVIPGAESAEFTPAAEHTGKSLTVEVTGSSPGYTTVSGVSNPRYVDPPGAIRVRVYGQGPSISGTPRVGSTLTAAPGEWRPEPSSFAYQWLADGVAIDGATAGTFKPGTDEGGKRVSVRVTATRPNYSPGTETSAETVPVTTATPFGAPQNLESTKTTITTIDLAWTKVDGAAKYRIYYGIGSGTRTKVEVGDVTSATLKGLKPGTTYSIDIAALKSDGTRSSYSPRIPVRTESFVPPSNLTVAAKTSTSLTLTWTKVPGVPKYRIYHGIGSGTRTKIEVGDVGTATITGLKPGTTYSIDIASLLSDGTRSAYTPRIDGRTAD